MADGQRTIKIRFDGSARGLSAAAKEARAQLRAVRQQAEEHNRRIAAMRDRLADITRSVVRNFAKVALAGAAIHGTVTVVAALTAALSNMLGVVGLLPGALAAMAAAMVAVKLGGEGIKRAFERLTPTLDRLRSAVSATFEERLRPAVDDLNDTLPRLQGNLTRVAASVSRVATRFTGMLQRGRNVRTLNTILATSARTIDNVGTALAPLGQALLDVAAVGGEVFADLTDGAGRAAEQFAAWVRAARDSGRLRRWIEGGIAATREFVGVLSDLGGIVSGVFSAIREGGGGVTSTLGPAIEKVREFVESADGQATFRMLGEVLADLSRILRTVLGPALELLQRLMEPVRQVVAAVADAAEEHLGPALDTLVSALGDVAEQLAPVIAGLVEDLAPILGPIAEAIANVVGPLADLAGAFDGLAIKIGLAVLALRSLRRVGLAGLGAAAATEMAGVTSAADKTGKSLGKSGKGWAGNLGRMFAQGLKLVGWVGLIYWVVDELTGGWLSSKVEEFFITAGTEIGRVFWDAGLGPGIVKAKKGLTDFGNFNKSAWRKMFGDTSAATWSISHDIGNKSARMRTTWSAALDGADRATKLAWARMVVTTRAKSLLAADEARAGGRKIRNAFAFSLWQQGSAILSSLRAGMASALPGVIGFAAGVAAQIAAVKGPIEKDRRLLVPQGKAIMDGLRAGMAAGLPSVLGLASQVAPGVAGAVGGRSYLSRTVGGTVAGSTAATVPASYEVRVFVGDRELTDIVRTEISESNRGIRSAVLSGVGGAR